jgi:hypothetical protein
MNEPDAQRAQVRAVLDRVEEGRHAVLLVGTEARELILPAEQLPEGAREGMWLRLTLEGDAVVELAIDVAETATRGARIEQKLDRLRSRPRRFRPRRRRE